LEAVVERPRRETSVMAMTPHGVVEK
jgi:hypothetical protein